MARFSILNVRLPFSTRPRAVWSAAALLLFASSCFSQSRREVVVGAPTDLVWYDDVESAVQAQRAGNVVLAVDLSRKRLRELPADLRLLTDLSYLIVSRNKLASVPEWALEMTDLKALVADYNRFEEFPQELLRMPHLKQVSLGENFLRAIPLDIDAMVDLEILSLWGNVVARFPASLGNLEHLQVLDLLHNEMTVDEQDQLKALLPDVQLNLSEPCNCEFDAGFSTYSTGNRP
ncbi:MAG: leucine-rich repeat domain-containing protein [Flavobacteriales bacterium]